MKRVAVVVLGDLARSPRMLRHARMLAGSGAHVDLFGYCDKPLALDPGVELHALHPLERAPEGSAPLRFLATSAARMGLLALELSAALVRARPDAILVQNPPSFPTLIAAWQAARITRAKLVVDWHNYGYSLLALRLPPGHPVVAVYRQYEERVARWADDAFCVSEAMRRELAAVGIDARVLYDKPLRPRPASETHAPRAGHVVCPTGWTADEDIPMFLEALRLLDGRLRTSEHTRLDSKLVVYLTGDGPLRASIERDLADRPFTHVEVRTGYLSSAEYRRVLATAELGVSLHRSTSGVDLAMKVVDLFEARVPVCALAVGTSLPEQVRDGATGVFFRNAPELADALDALLHDASRRAEMREHIAREWQEPWSEHWSAVAAPVFGLAG